MHWQEKFVPLEKLALAPARNTFISRQRDRTIACALVAEGAGVALVAHLTAEPLLKSGLAICALDEDVSMRYALVYPQLTARMALADAFAAELRHEFEWVEAGR